MKKESEMSEERRREEIYALERRQKFSWGGRFFLVILVLTVVLVLLLGSFGPFQISETLSDWMADMGKSGEFPVDVSGKNVISVKSQGSDMLLLTETGLQSYSATGKQLYNRVHGFSKPCVSTAGNRCIIYDSGGTGIRIETRGKTLVDRNMEQKIMTAAVSDSGHYAVVTEASGYNAVLRLYNRNNAEVLTWYSLDHEVVTAALSADGKKVAVAGLRVDEGVLVSTLFVLGTDSEEPLVRLEYPGTMLVSLRFKDADMICAIGDDLCAFVNIKAPDKANNYSYQSSRLYAYDDSRGNETALYISKYQDFHNGQLVVLGNKAEPKKTIETGEQAISVAFGKDGSLWALTPTRVLQYTDGGGDTQKNLNTRLTGLLALRGNMLGCGLQSIDVIQMEEAGE